MHAYHFPTMAAGQSGHSLFGVGGLGIADPVLMRPAARVACIVHFLQNAHRTLGFGESYDVAPHDIPLTLPLLLAQTGVIQPLSKWILEPNLLAAAKKPIRSRNGGQIRFIHPPSVFYSLNSPTRMPPAFNARFAPMR